MFLIEITCKNCGWTVQSSESSGNIECNEVDVLRKAVWHEEYCDVNV